MVVPGRGVEPRRPEGRRILSPLRLPVPPSRHVVEVIDFTACSLLLFFLLPKQQMRNCVTKCAAFRGFAQPTLILPTKCCDSFSGLDAHDPVVKGAPAQNSTIIVSESDLARQLNRSVRTLSSVSRRVGSDQKTLLAFVKALLFKICFLRLVIFYRSGSQWRRHK
jgi:hypothetical protein